MEGESTQKGQQRLSCKACEIVADTESCRRFLGTTGIEDTCEKTAEVLGNGGLSDCEGLSCHA